MREAGLSNRFCPSVCVSSKFWADHDNEGSLHHSNSGNSDKKCMVYLKVGEAVCSSIFQAFVAVVSFADCATRHKSDWGRDYRGRGYAELGYEFSQRVLVTPTPLGSYPDDEIRSGSAG